MGGEMSRRKGGRTEREVRDLMRAEGYESNRVPLSGASAYAKGDVKAVKDGHEVILEVKARRKEFDSLYSLFDRYNEGGVCRLAIRTASGCECVEIAYRASILLETGNRLFSYPDRDVRQQALRKLLGCKKWLKGAQLLVLKNNGKPYLFVRYYD